MSLPESLPTTGRQLIEYGQEWEDNVLSWLQQQPGWVASLHGQRVDDGLRAVVAGTDSAVRYTPDIIARTPNNRVVYIECKRTYAESTGNHLIETASLDAQVEWWTEYREPLLYAFPHNRGTSVCFMPVTSASAAFKPMRPSRTGRGSGTPYGRVAHTACTVNDPLGAILKAAMWAR